MYLQGYYFASSQEISQVELAHRTGKILKSLGKIDSAEPREVPIQDVDAMLPEFNSLLPGVATYLFAANSRMRPDRAKKVFGYSPSGQSLLDEWLEKDLRTSLEM